MLNAKEIVCPVYDMLSTQKCLHCFWLTIQKSRLRKQRFIFYECVYLFLYIFIVFFNVTTIVALAPSSLLQSDEQIVYVCKGKEPFTRRELYQGFLNAFPSAKDLAKKPAKLAPLMKKSEYLLQLTFLLLKRYQKYRQLLDIPFVYDLDKSLPLLRCSGGIINTLSYEQEEKHLKMLRDYSKDVLDFIETLDFLLVNTSKADYTREVAWLNQIKFLVNNIYIQSLKEIEEELERLKILSDVDPEFLVKLKKPFSQLFREVARLKKSLMLKRLNLHENLSNAFTRYSNEVFYATYYLFYKDVFYENWKRNRIDLMRQVKIYTSFLEPGVLLKRDGFNIIVNNNWQEMFSQETLLILMCRELVSMALSQVIEDSGEGMIDFLSLLFFINSEYSIAVSKTQAFGVEREKYLQKKINEGQLLCKEDVEYKLLFLDKVKNDSDWSPDRAFWIKYFGSKGEELSQKRNLFAEYFLCEIVELLVLNFKKDDQKDLVSELSLFKKLEQKTGTYSYLLANDIERKIFSSEGVALFSRNA